MKTRRGTIIMIVVGVVICVTVVGLGAGAWFFASAFDSTSSDEATAGRAFDDVTRRLGTSDPIIDIQNDRAIITRQPPEAAASELQRLQILTWNPDEDRLTRVTLPWWLLRLKSGSFDLNSEAGSGFHSTRITITPDEIERYGPALLVSHTEPDGQRVLVWTE
jgi:hypothetical protein